MVKQTFSAALVLALAACSSVNTEIPETYQGELRNVKEVCLYWPASSKNVMRASQIDDIPGAVQDSLKKLGIKYKLVEKNDACKYVMGLNVRPSRNRQLIEKATVRVRRIEGDTKTLIGTLQYARRGSEKDLAAEGGVDAQINSMLTQLFRSEQK